MLKKRAYERVQAFCRCWFEERNAAAAADFLTDDICFVGTGPYEYADGNKEMTAYINKDIASIREPFTCLTVPIQEQSLLEGLYHLSIWLTLKNSLYSWRLRMFFVLREADGDWKICNLNVSEPSRNQKSDEHYPDTLVIERIAQARQQLLDDSIAGGMMGGYIEDGFPIYFVNQRMLDHLGYQSEAEFVADIDGLVSNCMHPDDRAAVEESVDRQFASSDEYVIEYRMKKRDGSYIWVHDIGRRIKAEDGRDAIISVCIDITETKELQERIREKYSQEIAYFTELAAAEGSVQGRIDLTRNVVEAYTAPADVSPIQPGISGDELFRLFAASAAEVLQQEKLLEELTRAHFIEDFAEGKNAYDYQFLRRRRDGRLFWNHTGVRTSRNPENGSLMLLFCTADATESYLQRQFLAHLVEQDYDSITEIDLSRESRPPVSYRKKASEENATMTSAVCDSVSFSDLLQNAAAEMADDAARAEFVTKMSLSYMQPALDKHDSYAFTVQMLSDHGETRVKRYQVFYISRELKRVGITRSDVTDIVRREQRQREEMSVALLAAEQANAAKTNFLSRMSHEIRTPMNAIIGMTAIASQSLGDDDTTADCLSKISISSRFLLSLINDILDMSRIESGKMLLKNEDIPIEEFLNGINAICYGQAENKGVDYECIVDPVLDDYYVGDAMKLQQVLINILSNAIKFTEEGGTVTFSVQQRGRKKDSALLRFIINDTGIGMNEDFLPHIFEPFTQESTGTTALYGGTGLGLAISKNIIDLMGGKIAVRSIKGIGTEFTVDVTLGLSTREIYHRAHHKEELNLSHLKTLVVDDDVTVCESTVITLKDMGVRAEWVDSGRKAVDRVQELWDTGVYYDLILIDWKMPEMNGIETARRIRAIVGPEVTIIIMTAYDWGSIEHEAKLAGVNLLMSKPMFKSSLISAFSRAFGEKEEVKEQETPVVFDFTGRRVLLAEDNAINTEVAVRLLESKGFTVETAKNGLRALEMFSKSEPGYYDAILMDIRMPLMDGLVAAASIRHLSNPDASSVPIIAMTANAFDDDVDKSKAAGMNAHLAKPIDPQRLYQTLHDLINLRSEN